MGEQRVISERMASDSHWPYLISFWIMLTDSLGDGFQTIAIFRFWIIILKPMI
jgi:hypothetical protein